MPGVPFERFDGAAAWARLAPEVQARIGSIALELVVASRTAAIAGDQIDERALDTASDLLLNLIDRAVADVLPIDAATQQIPLLLGDVCRQCGCSDLDACETGAGPCHWVRPGLCSGCAPALAFAADSHETSDKPNGRRPRAA